MFTTLSPHSLVLTATKRLAAEYAQRSDQIHALPLSQWLINQWESVQENHDATSTIPKLLTPHQSLTLWHQIISNDSQTFIMQPFTTAKLAQQAYHLLKHWKISLESIINHHHPDVHTFAQWVTQYEAQLRTRNVIDENELCEALLKNRLKHINVEKIILAGFDALTPLQKHFMAQTNAKITFQEPLSQNVQCQVLPCESSDAEIQTAAHYFKHHLQKNSNQTFALIVPKLAPIRRKIAAIFHDVLSTNIAGGDALYHFPMISIAFRLLESHTTWLDIKYINTLLNSPFIAGAETEMIARAELDAIVRVHAETRVTLRQTLVFARQKESPHYAPQWVSLIESVLATLKAWPKEATPSTWSQHFSALLAAFGWPGERALDNEETQLQTALDKLFSAFEALDTVLGLLAPHDALHHLTQLAHNTVFHTKTEPAPIQILGMLEASGLSFDHVWITGLSDQHFPQAPTPHPFLPFELQREQHMPHADAEREHEFAEQILKRCINSGSQCIVSYPLFEKDQALRPSLFISDFPETKSEALKLNSPPSHQSGLQNRTNLHHTEQNDSSTDEEPDEYGPALKASGSGEHTNIRGGSGVLQSQAQCPFQAFARYRLNAHPLHSPTLGITPAERGTLVHAALAYFWNQVRSQKTLLALSKDQLETHVKASIDDAITNLRATRPLALQKMFSTIEYKRLTYLINQLINIEKIRSPFEVIATEKKHTATFGPYTLTLRIDRIDQLEKSIENPIENPIENKATWVIDYKTGNTPLSNWSNERLTDPQLPLYATTSTTPVDGIIIGTVRANTVEYKGLSSTASTLKKVKACDDWNEKITVWKQQIKTLIDEFTSGYAAVEPYTSTSCQYCELHGLCRINEHMP